MAAAVLSVGMSAALLAGPGTLLPAADAAPIVSRSKTTAEQELLEELMNSGAAPPPPPTH